MCVCEGVHVHVGMYMLLCVFVFMYSCMKVYLFMH